MFRQVIDNGSDESKFELEVRTNKGVRIIPPGKWWINRNTPVGEPADFYECKPYGGKKLLDSSKCRIINDMYTAIVLHPESSKVLSQKFPMPLGWRVFCHHCTIAMGAIHELVGQVSVLTVTHFSMNSYVAAVRVAIANQDLAHLCVNKYPHVTLCVSPLGKPVMSNNITEWFPVEQIVLHGEVKICK